MGFQTKSGIFLIIFVTELYAQTTLIRRGLDDYDLAKCNDGSAAAYYHQEDVRFAGEDVMIYLPDGGQCSDVEECRSRCREGGNRGRDSSKDNCASPTEKVLEKTDAIWSDNPLVNPFADHFKVYLHYCSSDNYAGTRGPSKSTGDFHFHGKHIVTATLEDLSRRFGLDGARSLTLVGTGSGARGVGHNCDYAASLLPGVDVRCIADSPDMVPWWVRTDDCQERDFEKEENEKILWGREDDETCAEEFKNVVNSSELAHRCGVWSRYWPHIQTPFFIVDSQFDPESFNDNPCLPDVDDPDFPEFELAWRRGVGALYESMLASRRDRGWFIPDCSTHGFLDGKISDARLARLSAPDIDNNQTVSLTGGLTAWLQSTSAPLHAIDQIAKGNRDCPGGSAPLCKSKCGAGGRRGYNDYPLVRRRLQPPSSLYPSGYDRRYGAAIDPLYNRGGVRGGYGGYDGARRTRLIRRLVYLRNLRNLYQKHKNEYARDYYGYNNRGVGLRGSGVGLRGSGVGLRGSGLGGVRGYADYDDYDLGVGRYPGILGGRGLADIGGGRGLTDLLGGDYYDYDYDDYGSGLLSRIRNAIRLRKKQDNKEPSDKSGDEVREDDFDYVEDFGPVVEKIRALDRE